MSGELHNPHDRVQPLDDGAELLLKAAAAFLRKGEYEQAAGAYTECIRLNPECAVAYMGRGRCAGFTGQHADAIEDYDSAAELDPESAHPPYHRAISLVALGRSDEALRDLNRSLELRPDLAEAYRARAAEFFRRGRYQEAIGDCDEAIRLQPDFGEAYFQRSLLCSQLGRAAEAAADREEAISLGWQVEPPDVSVGQPADLSTIPPPSGKPPLEKGADATESMNPGVIGQYELEYEIGRGGMGIVYRARDPIIGRRVAIKALPLSAAGAAQESARFGVSFLHEASAAGQLSHPNIVSVYHVVPTHDKIFIVMELVEGGTLRDELRQSGVLPFPRSLDFLSQAAAALDYAHEHGIIHRDVKPGNFMVRPDGVLKLADFGIAKIVATKSTTITNSIRGTPQYMSPEQATGQRLDRRSDQFSLAVLAWELLTGKLPFSGDTDLSTLYNIVHSEPEWADVELPEAACRALAKALEKSPDERYDSCQLFVAALSEGLRPAPKPEGRKASWLDNVRRVFSRNRE